LTLGGLADGEDIGLVNQMKNGSFSTPIMRA